MAQWGVMPDAVNSERRMWEMYHLAWNRGAIEGRELYREYSDANLARAMKKILRGK